jgi:hypothetical protein
MILIPAVLRLGEILVQRCEQLLCVHAVAVFAFNERTVFD